MNRPAIMRYRQKLADGKSVFGLWITLEAPSITEMAVAIGLDWVVIDAEHRHLDWKDITAHLRAAARSDTVALVRVSELNISLIKRALDVGADGVVVPWMESADQLREALSYARYPPAGRRGIGGERATCWGHCLAEHTAEADDHVLVVPIVESVRGTENVRDLVSVDGVETFFFGPADLSATAGYPGQWEGPGVADRIRETVQIIRDAGKHVGVVTTGQEDLRCREDGGFRMLGLGLDAGFLLRHLRTSLESAAGRSVDVLARLTPPAGVEAPAQRPVLPRPPDSMRPDRPEVMNPAGRGKRVDVAPGIRFDCLVGPHNQARNLTTGIVSVEGGARLACHRHPYGESITVLEGGFIVEVEGRRYRLGPLDNITIPRGLAHAAMNASMRDRAVLHVAMASTDLIREPVDTFFTRRGMPDAAGGIAGGERVTRYALADKYEAGPNTSFVDYFNSNLMPDIEMSGGYGRFATGGRLPAHIHDFDESICIVEGLATCVVEGRRYRMSDRSTALQPRGRVHYFINEEADPMAMVWVYAGPLPERIIVDERCATEEGDPWRDIAVPA